ncbi:MAG: DUF177 domain-containing protein [Erythrobacter sp.]
MEFSRPTKDRLLPADPIVIEANEAERAALAERFAIVSIESLSASVSLEPAGKAVLGKGTLTAKITQACAISGDDFVTAIAETLQLKFVEETPGDAPSDPDEMIDVDLTSDKHDEIEYSGATFDLGEAVAQTLGLAIDPYAEGPNADATREKAGIVGDDTPSGPLAEALAALKSK